MNRRLVFALAPALLLALTGAARKPAAHRPPPPPPPLVLGDVVRVVMTTEQGVIELALDHAHAPLTVENFVRYADLRRFDGMAFYRVMRLPWGDPPNGLIQAGLRGDPRKMLKPVAHEPTSLTGLTHKAGSLSMARFAPGTATADFSILLSDIPQLDANPTSSDPEAQAGFAVFGQVVTGMDVVRRIFDAPLSLTAGDGPMKGQMLEPTVKVISVRRLPD